MRTLFTHDGSVPDAFPSFPDTFRGARLRPGQDGYARSRAIYNMRHPEATPAMIARPADQQDVAVAMRYASATGTPVALRAGGHGIDATAMPDRQLVLDLGAFSSIEVDRTAATVRLGAGVLLGQMDTALQEYGLVVPAGTVSTTGIAGLTVGGGVGYNMRRYGATVDSLLSCEVVTANGQIVQASAEENAELFWALRGGGGNFGVVTSFTYQAHPLPTTVAAGMIPFPLSAASEVMAALRDYMPTAPRELGIIGAMTQCPPLPPVAAEYHGADVLMLVVVHTGTPESAERVIKELTALGPSIATAVVPTPWRDANRMLDVIAPQGRRVYTKGGYLSELTDQIVAIAARHAEKGPASTAPPVPSTVQNFWSLGGAISEDFAESSVAFSREGATWFWEAVAQWDVAADDDTFETWAEGLHADIQPHLRSNGYVNLTTDKGAEWRRGLWGAPSKYQRLTEAKTTWDPQNLLRFNKNILPLGG